MATARIKRDTDGNGQARAFVPPGGPWRIQNISGQNIQGGDYVIIQVDTTARSLIYTDERYDGTMPPLRGTFISPGSEIIFEHRMDNGQQPAQEQIDIILRDN